jgi:hypothetical protein
VHLRPGDRLRPRENVGCGCAMRADVYDVCNRVPEREDEAQRPPPALDEGATLQDGVRGLCSSGAYRAIYRVNVEPDDA